MELGSRDNLPPLLRREFDRGYDSAKSCSFAQRANIKSGGISPDDLKLRDHSHQPSGNRGRG